MRLDRGATYLVALMTVLSAPNVEAGRRGKDASLAVPVGVPSLIGGELSFLTGKFNFGASLGFAPIQSFMERKIQLKSIDISDQFSLKLRPEYSLTSLCGLVKYFPNTEGFFLQAVFSQWKLKAVINGDLADNQGRFEFQNAVQGTLLVTQRMAGLMAGYEVYLGPTVFIDLAAGLMYLFKPTFEASIGGPFASVASLIPGLETEFQTAKDKAGKAVTDAIADYRKSWYVFPAVQIAFGASF